MACVLFVALSTTIPAISQDVEAVSDNHDVINLYTNRDTKEQVATFVGGKTMKRGPQIEMRSHQQPLMFLSGCKKWLYRSIRHDYSCYQETGCLKIREVYDITGNLRSSISDTVGGLWSYGILPSGVQLFARNHQGKEPFPTPCKPYYPVHLDLISLEGDTLFSNPQELWSPVTFRSIQTDTSPLYAFAGYSSPSNSKVAEIPCLQGRALDDWEFVVYVFDDQGSVVAHRSEKVHTVTFAPPEFSYDTAINHIRVSLYGATKTGNRETITIEVR